MSLDFPSKPLLRALARGWWLLVLLSIFGCSGPPTPPPKSKPAPPPAASTPKAEPTRVSRAPAPTLPPSSTPVLLGIDVLAARNFAPLAGKRVGLLTHPAGVNRAGISTLEVLRKAPNVTLVALFGPEHGIYGNQPAGENIQDTLDKRTGLPAYSLYGKNRRPTKAQLKGLDALVIDLQDIGSRSYTFNVCMKYAIEACFENNVEVIVLDRPNPLGGIKVDGPILDKSLFSGVGAYSMPYVHGLTIGELARLAAGTPGALDVPEAVRARGRLTVIPMSGWRRSMRWPDTGLTFVPTSPFVQDFAACVGYSMTGLGCMIGNFAHGVGNQYPFRGVYLKDKPVDLVLKELQALRLPGLGFRKVSVPKPTGQPATGVYIEITDWEDWHPTDLSFHMMKLACKLSARNPFAAANGEQIRSFNIHSGAPDLLQALKRDGARVDVDGFIRKWRAESAAFQERSKRFWLYN